MTLSLLPWAQALRLELLVQLVLAVLLGGLIGAERELRGKPAGLRTNILICIGATLFTVLSYHVGGPADPARIASQILAGVGFIGAGTILHMRGAVTGLTSAATIWVVAAIGMAIGSSAYVEAIGSAFLVLAVLTGVEKFEEVLQRRSARTRFLIHATPGPTSLSDIEALAASSGLEIERTVSRKENADIVLEMTVRGPKRLHDQLLLALVHHPAVRGVTTGE